VDVTPDGSVWLSGIGDGQDLLLLGEERVFEGRMGEPLFREVAPDGSLWITDGRGIYSFDGEGWTVRATTTDRLWVLAVGPDGTVWATAEDRDKHCPDIEADDCSGTVLLRLEDDGSLTTIEDWADDYDGDAWSRKPAVSPDGDVWLVSEGRMLLRFDGEGWEAIPGPEGWALGSSLAIGPDGTLWVNDSGDGDVARYDDAGWTTFTDADGVEPWVSTSAYWGYMEPPAVAADGSLWLRRSEGHGCGGTAHYEGTTWTSYLVGYCINDIAIAPDGSAWLGASAYDDDIDIAGPSSLYVITPEAVAATE
jgi:sugar lactone lactonase YvrE